MFEVCILIWLSRLLYTHVAYEIVIQKITTCNWHEAGIDLSCRTAVKCKIRRPDIYMDGHREWEEISVSREI